MMTNTINLSEIEHRFVEHSIFAPSSSKMWANCSGSLIPNILDESNKTSYEASEGTTAHMIGEKWLSEKKKPIRLLNTIHEVDGFEIPITLEMFEYVEEYVNYCEMLKGKHYVETRVDFSNIMPIKNQTGTCDHAAVDYKDGLTITDLKYGKGIRVDIKDNTQLVLYAYGFFRRFDKLNMFKKITMRIAQPRLNHYDEITLTRDEFLKKVDWLRERAVLAWQPNAPRTPSVDSCQWCKVKSTCAALAVETEKIINGTFDNLDVSSYEMVDLQTRLSADMFKLVPIEVSTLTTEQIAKFYPYMSLVDSFFKQLYNTLYERMSGGETVEGYKLVNGRGSRSFKDEKLVAEELEFLGLSPDDLYKRSFISPAQAEDLLVSSGYKLKTLPTILDGFIVTEYGSPTVAPLSDKRPAIATNVDDIFDNLEDDIL